MMQTAAAGTPEPETDDLEEVFFSTPPPAYQSEPEIEPWAPQPMTRGQRRAMTATIVMLGCAALAALVFVAFAELVMVSPAPLSAVQTQLPEHSYRWTVSSAANAPSAEPIAAPASAAAVAIGPAQPAPSQPVAIAPAEPQTTPAAPSAPAASERSAEPARSAKLAPAGAARPATRSASPADGLIKRAYAELGSGQPREAQLLANQAILLDPTRARSYIVLGGARDALGDQAGKRAAFQACVRNATDALVSTCRTLAR